jgi:hypothetical protein
LNTAHEVEILSNVVDMIINGIIKSLFIFLSLLRTLMLYSYIL